MKKVIAGFLTALIVIQAFALNYVNIYSSAEGIETHVLANWDDPDKSPAAPEGAEIKIPYDGYKFGNALITGIKTIGLTPNEEAANDSMIAMYIACYRRNRPLDADAFLFKRLQPSAGYTDRSSDILYSRRKQRHGYGRICFGGRKFIQQAYGKLQYKNRVRL